jgi:ribonuclease PH
MAAATVAVATAVVIMAAATVAVATAVVIPNLIVLILINPLEQKVGKTEVMVILLKTLNMKVVGAGEKEECPMTGMIQSIQIKNPFLLVL